VNDASDSKSHSNFKYSYISRLLLVRNWNLHPLGGEMGNGYRRYRDSLVDTLAGTDAELYTESTNIL